MNNEVIQAMRASFVESKPVTLSTVVSRRSFWFLFFYRDSSYSREFWKFDIVDSFKSGSQPKAINTKRTCSKTTLFVQK